MEMEKWESVGYLYKLMPDHSVQALFGGFNKSSNQNWQTKKLDEHKVYTTYKKLKSMDKST
jgi:hypothetical protein